MRPVPNRYPVSLPYGAPGDYIAGYHTGTDFACPVGTVVVSPWDGTVTKVATSPGDYGLYVQIVGIGKRRSWVLAHLSRAFVGYGQTVKRGDKIGLSGQSGNAHGAHLHAEERHPPFGYRDNQRPTAWRNG